MAACRSEPIDPGTRACVLGACRGMGFGESAFDKRGGRLALSGSVRFRALQGCAGDIVD